MQQTGFDGLTWEETREETARLVVIVHRFGDRFGGCRYFELRCLPLTKNIPEAMTHDPCYRPLGPASPLGHPPTMGWIFSPVFGPSSILSTTDTYTGCGDGNGEKAWLVLRRGGFFFEPYIDQNDRASNLDGL